MSQIQADIDALLAQATALAEEPPPPAALRPAKAASRPTIPPPSSPDEDPARILRLVVPVIVRLAERTMPLEDIINLGTGAIIEFDKPAEAELDLMINNKCIGTGQAVKVGENFGLRITSIGSVRDRIEALGPKRSAKSTKQEADRGEKRG
ncbi:MAG TPA: FliM/FliN family flagellar motor C-terminal domain-containing protein [Phycisphaerae bacterium]|jgi:flagellar motor switch protein FliN/FliY|nr:FliM/FliN family flagellar motor switch protein [Phycisphaerae bacterium]HOB74982.1 FliM/FliN family flagellar motor C-terminal domain-containing protein [Phycisphaerae bacterium]HOJ55771.1 FliM/FliN family flagellar motor C-terminal domain-containing protein [Phycisphaerae bacterium]HOL25742.1 FliM/FliN family flagellar motor C-terminal domain-containing protein [Phycisphaerae bacterium]HPP19565.1 FliM/FliN family flagellar motor C-terminal domain-containing protein [Phycisphaerae bacterium